MTTATWTEVIRGHTVKFEAQYPFSWRRRYSVGAWVDPAVFTRFIKVGNGGLFGESKTSMQEAQEEARRLVDSFITGIEDCRALPHGQK